jgi:hypothetical protein
MQIAYLPILYPDFIAHIGVAILLLYRKHRRGFAYRKIKLTKGKHALVDPEDYERIAEYDWQFIENGGNCYARSIGGCGNFIYMHRQIRNNPAGVVVDHKDGDGLNNMRGNLRIVTRSQNNYNSRKTLKKRSSKYKGVSLDKEKNRWRATIRYNGRNKALGYFANEEDAARAYDEAAKKYHGEFAWLNFDERRTNENRPAKTVLRSICGVIADVFCLLWLRGCNSVFFC